MTPNIRRCNRRIRPTGGRGCIAAGVDGYVGEKRRPWVGHVVRHDGGQVGFTDLDLIANRAAAARCAAARKPAVLLQSLHVAQNGIPQLQSCCDLRGRKSRKGAVDAPFKVEVAGKEKGDFKRDRRPRISASIRFTGNSEQPILTGPSCPIGRTK